MARRTSKSSRVKAKPGLTIGKLARAANVGVETVRFYQRRALIEEPSKPKHHQRRYSNRTLERLKFIRRAQAAGFTLREIATLLDLGTNRCADVRSLARSKLIQIDRQLAEFHLIRGRLEELLKECGRTGSRECGMVAALAKDKTSTGE
jgi:MerR family transcriptional regulator, mercuric resistance operon regulatory protein